MRSGGGTATAHPSRSRWPVLISYSLLVAATQLLWLSFAPITVQTHRTLGVSEQAIGDLAGIQPLLYVLLALPAGQWTDRRFRPALSAGAALTAGGALLRLAGAASYPVILAGQFLVAVGQPLVLNSTTKIAARYFPAAERTTAIAVATGAQFVGILAAALSGDPLLQTGGLYLVLLVDAVVAAVAAAGVLAAVHVPATFAAEPGATSSGPSPSGATLSGTRASLHWLRGDRVLWLLGGLLFIGIGVFNALATWLDAILAGFGHHDASGSLISTMTVCGIVGAAVLPSAAARWNRRRALLLVTITITVLAFLAIAALPNLGFITAVLALEGFVLLAGLPVALDWSELHAGPQRAGTATGFLLLAGNLGGAVLVLAVQFLIGNPYLALAALSVMAAPGLALAAALPARVTVPVDPPVTAAVEGPPS